MKYTENPVKMGPFHEKKSINSLFRKFASKIQKLNCLQRMRVSTKKAKKRRKSPLKLNCPISAEPPVPVKSNRFEIQVFLRENFVHLIL